jgi:hypothetical protein
MSNKYGLESDVKNVKKSEVVINQLIAVRYLPSTAHQ